MFTVFSCVPMTEPSGQNAECSPTVSCIEGFICDLSSGLCVESQPTCEDKIQNQNETDIDCGGPCSECNNSTDYCSADSIYMTGNFENGNFEDWFVSASSDNCVECISISNDFAREGLNSVKINLTCDSPRRESDSAQRAEIRHPIGWSEPMNSERWYGFSTFLPENWESDYNTSRVVMAQWHATPQKREGEIARSPPVSLRIENNKWYIPIRSSSERINLNNYDNIETLEYYLDGNIVDDLGEWTDWVFHAKWSYQDDGFLQVFKNGVLVIDHKGPVIYNDIYGPKFQGGIYQTSDICQRLYYIDSIKFADEKGNYECVTVN